MRCIIAIGSIILIFACTHTHQNGETSQDQQALDTNAIIQKGQEITAESFTTLSSNLQKAMSEGGVEHALEFCNIKAYPLTDSLSEHFGVEVRRASHKPRNPSNRADSLELSTIETYIRQIAKKEVPQARVLKNNNQILYHAPIRISSQLCLNCHGDPGDDITSTNLDIIDSLYPHDKARGFELGELRGIWSVHFSEDYLK